MFTLKSFKPDPDKIVHIADDGFLVQELPAMPESAPANGKVLVVRYNHFLAFRAGYRLASDIYELDGKVVFTI